jgi:cyclin B
MLEEDRMHQPNGDYMKEQPELRPKLRGIALEWLLDVHTKFKLLPETLFLSINYIDRFFSKVSVKKGDIQLVAVTCLRIAGKYEEIYPPEMDDYIFVCDNAYNKEQILACEMSII